MADPVCPRLSALAADAAEAAGAPVTRGGYYLAMEGPQFSTRAESQLYRAWGCDVIGMTAMPEAKLAREAELPYALIGMVTDYDCWREGERAGRRRRQIVARLHANAGTARRLVVELAQRAAGGARRPRRSTPISTPPSSPRPRRAIRRWWRSSTRSAGGCWRDEAAAALCPIPRHPHRALGRGRAPVRHAVRRCRARAARLSPWRRDRRPARIRRLRRALRGAGHRARA